MGPYRLACQRTFSIEFNSCTNWMRQNYALAACTQCTVECPQHAPHVKRLIWLGHVMIRYIHWMITSTSNGYAHLRSLHAIPPRVSKSPKMNDGAGPVPNGARNIFIEQLNTLDWTHRIVLLRIKRMLRKRLSPVGSVHIISIGVRCACGT